MATTYPLPTLAAVIGPSGISAPSYDDVLASLQASFRLIYGADAYVEPDSQDGQWIAIIAKAITDCNQGCIAAYNSYAPSTAQGVGLSNVVRINGIARKIATNSQVILEVFGVAGSIINGGQVADVNGNKWNLPATVIIDPDGSSTVTATAVDLGSIEASPATITQILTPTAGWQSVTNPTAASPGAPIETDAELRLRQQRSTALNSEAAIKGLYAAVAALDGVTTVKAYENDTNATDANGLPAHSVSLVVLGGNSTEIAQTILNTKSEGVATYGTTTVAVPDAVGMLRDVNYFVPTEKAVKVTVELTAFTGYTSLVATAIKQALADYVNALEVGADVLITRLYVPAQLYGASSASTYEVITVKASFAPAAVGTTDLVVAFNEKAALDLTNVTITVIP